jgi:hypothetical protein
MLTFVSLSGGYVKERKMGANGDKRYGGDCSLPRGFTSQIPVAELGRQCDSLDGGA